MLKRPLHNAAVWLLAAAHALVVVTCSASQVGDEARPGAADPGRTPDWAASVAGGGRCIEPTDLTASEREVLAYTNALRTQPHKFAEHLEALRPRFEGTLMRLGPTEFLRTHEGIAAVDEAIAALKAQNPLQPLRFCKGLTDAARDHARDSGPSGRTGHQGTDGSWPHQRVSRHGKWFIATGENISYGWSDGLQVVIQLVVDDGVPSRGHRSNLLNPVFAVSGAGCGPHQALRHLCVVEYAGDFAE